MMTSTHTSSSPPPMLELPFAFSSDNTATTTTTTTTSSTSTTKTHPPIPYSDDYNRFSGIAKSDALVATIPTTAQHHSHELRYDFYQDYYAVATTTASSSPSLISPPQQNQDEDENGTYVTVSEPETTTPTSSSPSEEEEEEPNNLFDDTILSSLLANDPQISLVESLLETAHSHARNADEFLQNGDLTNAISFHSASAKCYRDAALALRDTGQQQQQQQQHAGGSNNNGGLSNSLLLLSRTRARDALALKRVVLFRQSTSKTKTTTDPKKSKQESEEGEERRESMTKKDTFRDVLRTALDDNKEEDMTDSVFLGSVVARRHNAAAAAGGEKRKVVDQVPKKEVVMDVEGVNPVDDMMKLEKELRDMDMTISVTSLTPTTTTRCPNTEGSFYILPNNTTAHSSSSSYMSSSLWTHTPNTTNNNKRPPKQQPQPPPSQLESSWYPKDKKHTPTNTNQIIRLLDALKTLTDENATLLKQINQAQSARTEAQSVFKEMQQFKIQYNKRFQHLKLALDKFRKENPLLQNNPVERSEYVVHKELKKKDVIIRKLAEDLRTEREESKKKDAALKKYEGFYREVKKRSELKARQKEMEDRKRLREKGGGSLGGSKNGG